MTRKFELSRLARNCTNEEIIAEVKRVSSLIKEDIVSQKMFNKYTKVSSSTARKRFGSWKRVLVAAGLGHRYADRPEFKKARGRKLTNEEIVVELQRIGKLLGKESITIEDFMKHSSIEMHPESVRRRFGSWGSLMERAGLKLSPEYHRRYSKEEYFENLLNVWTYHGRQPLYRQIDEYPSRISSGAYENRFGTWRKALEAFVDRMNEDKKENKEVAMVENKSLDILEPKREIKPKNTIPRGEDSRTISLSLRYKVLVRDNFRCVRCGRSPATTPGVELQIDHKKPFSNQGKTSLENLETKCKECNLGKGDRHIE